MAGINITEAAKIAKRINRRWPGAIVGRLTDGGPHEVRTASGQLIASHEDLGECMRAADKLAAEKEAP